MAEKEFLHWKELANPNYLGVYSLPFGQDVVLSIKSHRVEEMYDTIKQKKIKHAVIEFMETYDWVRPMVPNKSTLAMLEIVTGTTNALEGVGKKVQIGSTQTKYMGRPCLGLTIRNVSSDELQKQYDTFVEEIESANSQDELKALFDKYSLYKPFDANLREKINVKWSSLSQKSQEK